MFNSVKEFHTELNNLTIPNRNFHELALKRQSLLGWLPSMVGSPGMVSFPTRRRSVASPARRRATAAWQRSRILFYFCFDCGVFYTPFGGQEGFGNDPEP
mgnify:CR=1 FL=1